MTGQLPISPAYRSIYAAVRRVPKGRVATYGQIATAAGLPGRARQVGYALHALPTGSDVPWQRILNARGEVSDRSVPGVESIQRAILEAEGVVFDARGRVDLTRFRWSPARRARTTR
ncbi:MAG: MGMT family protein [Myxococcales bacterium]|nr:MGMT family protein [Myxococcales bacterium]